MHSQAALCDNNFIYLRRNNDGSVRLIDHNLYVPIWYLSAFTYFKPASNMQEQQQQQQQQHDWQWTNPQGRSQRKKEITKNADVSENACCSLGRLEYYPTIRTFRIHVNIREKVRKETNQFEPALRPRWIEVVDVVVGSNNCMFSC